MSGAVCIYVCRRRVCVEGGPELGGCFALLRYAGLLACWLARLLACFGGVGGSVDWHKERSRGWEIGLGLAKVATSLC